METRIPLKVTIHILQDVFTKKVTGIQLQARQKFYKKEEVKQILESIIFVEPDKPEILIVKADFNNRDLAISRLKQLGYLEEEIVK